MDEVLQVIGVVLGLWGNWLIGQRRRSAFAVWGVSNLAIIAVNLKASLYIMASLFVVYLAFCVRNYVKWSREEGQVGEAVRTQSA